ncbi:MAG: PKD domain-containing protein [Planctomycetota bacterium]|nr:MAG: PKD domain-containing protein [Planctomycetota bacterium]
MFIFSVLGPSCNIKGFKDKPYPTPRVIVTTPAGVQQEDITLTYRLIEVDGTGSDISLEFSTNGGSTWNPGTAKGGDGTSNVKGYRFPGVQRTIVWDSLQDGITGTQTCRIKLIATKAGSGAVGTPGVTKDFEVQNPDFPVISWIARPEGAIRQVPLTFTWKLDTPTTPIANYYYGLDEDPPTTVTANTSVTIPAPSLGAHTFRVYAQSAAGLDSAILVADFTCDNAAVNQPPTVIITSGPSGATTDNTPTFEYLGGDPDGSVAGYFVSIDEDPPSNWTVSTTWTPPELAEGGHTFRVIAQDNEGANSSTASRSFTVTSTLNEPPTVAITSGPTGRTTDATPGFSYEGNDTDGVVTGYYVGIDTNPPTIWTTSTNWTSGTLLDGPHAFHVMARDDGDALSAVATRDFTVDTAGTGDPFSLPFEAKDMVFDAARLRIYACDSTDNRTVSMNALTGNIDEQVYHARMPEALFMTHDGTTLYVGLIESYSVDDFSQVSKIGLAGFTGAGGFDVTHRIYDIVATDTGIAVITNSRLDAVLTYDATSGVKISERYAGNANDRLRLHPDQRQVYGADTGLSPSDIGRFLIHDNGSITNEGDSFYHGDHRMDGNIWISPTSNYVVTRGADVFTAIPVRAADMRYLLSIANDAPFGGCVFYPEENLLAALEGSAVNYYNMQSFIRQGSTSLSDTGRFIGIMGGQVYVASFPGDGTTAIDYFDIPCIGGGTNTPPIAVADYSPKTGLTTSTNITFSATGSSDAEDGTTGLLYRWDFNNDGTFDTAWSLTATAQHTYNNNGLYLARLEVRDTFDLVRSHTFPVEISTDYFTTPDPTSFTIDGICVHVEPDPSRHYCYVSFPARHQVHEVNLQTGQVERTLTLSGGISALGLPPDGSRLYVGCISNSTDIYHEDLNGKIIIVDTGTFSIANTFEVEGDPFELQATDSGLLFVGAGTYGDQQLCIYDTNTGEKMATASIDVGSMIAVHPDQNEIIVAYSGSLKHHWLAANGSITASKTVNTGARRSVWCAPTGDFVLIANGEIRSLSDNASEDLALVDDIAFMYIRDAVLLDSKNSIFTIDDDTYFHLYAYGDLSHTTQFLYNHSFQEMFASQDTVFIIRRTAVTTEFIAVKPK